jgi:hypothetical protein
MAVARRATEEGGALPAELLEALEGGVLTQEQLRELISIEAAQLGLGFDEAVKRAREGSLPKNPVGLDLELLVELLPA